MADKTSVTDWSTTPDSNDNIAGIPLGENLMYPRHVNNAFRNMMAQIKTALGSATVDLGATIHALTGKTPPIDADEFGISDSAATNAGKKVTWANIKATMFAAWGALIAAGTNKTTPVDADKVALSDSAASNATKYATFTQMWAAYFKGKADALYQPLTTILSALAALTNAAGSLTNDGSGNLSWVSGGSGLTLLSSGTPSGSAYTVTGLATTYSSFYIEFIGVSVSSSSVVQMNISSDNGSTFDTAKNINSTAASWTGALRLDGVGGTVIKMVTSLVSSGILVGVFTTKTSPTNSIRFTPSFSFNGGTIKIWGIP